MKKLPEINALVVLSNEPGSTIYRVKEASGFDVGVIDATIEAAHPNQTIRWIDKSLLAHPSNYQLAEFNQEGAA